MNWFVIVAPCSGSWSCNVWSVYTKLDEFSLVLKSLTRSNHRVSSVATSLRTIFPVSVVGQAWGRTIKLLRKNGLRRKLLVLTWLQFSCRKLRGTQTMIISSPLRREELRAGGAWGEFLRFKSFTVGVGESLWRTWTHHEEGNHFILLVHTGSHDRDDRQHMHEKIIETFCF